MFVKPIAYLATVTIFCARLSPHYLCTETCHKDKIGNNTLWSAINKGLFKNRNVSVLIKFVRYYKKKASSNCQSSHFE